MPAVLDLADLAAEQWGLVTTAQARSVGVSAQAVARLTGQGALERLTHGVYRVSGAPPSPLDDLRAAWLALDPARRAGERIRDHTPAVVSHRSAAEIHEIGDLEADQFEFTTADRKQTRRPGIRLHRATVGPAQWTVVEGLPVTSVIRTVSDLAADHVDGGHLASVVRDALIRQQVDDRQLIAELRKYAHRYGAPMGDGQALLQRFLQEAGVSEPIGRAVELAETRELDSAALEALATSGDLQRLQEQLASIQRAIAPAARISEQIANSPALGTAAETARHLRSSEALGQIAALADSSAFRRLAAQYEEAAEMSRIVQKTGAGTAESEQRDLVEDLQERG